MQCHTSTVPWQTITLETLKGESVSLGEIGKKGSVLFFLSPECPLCENYSLNINQLTQEINFENVILYGVFPGTYYSRSQIKAYKIKYEMEIPFLLDPHYNLTHSLGATVTPEVFVFNKNYELIYQGAIDNWMVSLGKKRTVVTEHYLSEALSALINDHFPDKQKTKPIGCYIE